jgi:hypothetical protein
VSSHHLDPETEDASRILKDAYSYSEICANWIAEFRDHVLELDDEFELAEGAIEMLEVYWQECERRVGSLGHEANLQADSAFDAAVEGFAEIVCTCGESLPSAHSYVAHLADWLRTFAPQHLDQTRRRADHRHALYSHVDSFNRDEVLARLHAEFNAGMQVLGAVPTEAEDEYHPAMPPAYWQKKTGLSRDSLLRREKDGQLRIKRDGKKWRVHKADVAKIIEL